MTSAVPRPSPEKQRRFVWVAPHEPINLGMIEEVTKRARDIGLLGDASFEIVFNQDFLRDEIIVKEPAP